MIELKNVTAGGKGGGVALENFSEIFPDGRIRRFDLATGETVINVILGFLPVREGYVCFDGMPLDARSVTFIRKMIAYIPSPEGFQKVEDLAGKQTEMIDGAMQSDANIVLAVDPFSHLTGEQRARAAKALEEKARQGAVVIVATDRDDLI